MVYGACNAIVKCDFIENANAWQAKEAYVNHGDRVNCVKWINDEFIISGSTDKSIVLWQRDLGTDKIVMNSRLLEHEGSVTCLDGMMNDKKKIIVSGSADSTMRVWIQKLEEDVWECKHVYQCPKLGFIFDVKLIKGQDGLPWIFASFDDCTIRLFNLDGEELVERHILK